MFDEHSGWSLGFSYASGGGGGAGAYAKKTTLAVSVGQVFAVGGDGVGLVVTKGGITYCRGATGGYGGSASNDGGHLIAGTPGVGGLASDSIGDVTISGGNASGGGGGSSPNGGAGGNGGAPGVVPGGGGSGGDGGGIPGASGAVGRATFTYTVVSHKKLVVVNQ